ncbi:aminodeoxychorismate synthase component I [Vulcanibacillus modesticaldus]|uniref:Aminodeoxychorismate synthase component I n=1 Tax=Vulcanibacillus modesticaldus TaxID=337097 RepID=A0A1D2YXI6_9BACI|nr:aminodeoxychorismate synthase component I [Vulcanibacillus modesticaldus]
MPIGIKKKFVTFDPIKLFQKVNSNGEYSFIFESGRIGRYTYIGGDPVLVIKGKDYQIAKINRAGDEVIYYGNPLEILKGVMDGFSVPKIKELPKFFGGAIGYLSYDMGKYFEKLPEIATDDVKVPDLYLMIIDKVWIYDNQEQELHYVELVHFEDGDSLKEIYDFQLKKLLQVWDDTLSNIDENTSNIKIYNGKVDRSIISTSFTEEGFIDAVKKVQDYIAQGDVFQVNLSVRQSRRLNSDGFNIYQHLRLINPSPYMGYIKFPDVQLVSGSPELLIEVSDGYIQTRPIAGTRPRGRDEHEDEMLVKDLLGNEKETAEHVMLVDLERNDLGRVCKFGTVKVNEFMVVEKYSHVMHIVSNVIGQIDDKKDIYDCIRATFPGGTITGAPKIRTMEIIEELEPVKRGPYTGSMGWISFSGDLELNILIRTLLVKDGVGYIQAGAGIVIDSIPKNEYIESLNKAEALWRAVESSEKAIKETRP